jgi:hypothetical protein
VIVKFLILVGVFFIASIGSTYFMYKKGYWLPKNLTTKQDYLLVLYKLILFTVIAIVQIAILMALGIDLFMKK